MIGTGYVGLVSGTCFADIGNQVICVDKDIDKIQVNNKQKPSKEDAKKSHKEENKRIEKSVEVESLQKDKPNTGVSEEPRPDIVKETEVKEKVKSAKDWGRASNDPRNKS